MITATSTDLTVASMRLQPYQTETGTIFDPTSLGANLTVSLVAPGSFTITLVGAPPPACNLGGTYATPCAQAPITVKSLNAAGAIIGPASPTELDHDPHLIGPARAHLGRTAAAGTRNLVSRQRRLRRKVRRKSDKP